MAVTEQTSRENDVVELRAPVGRWPAGTTAVVHAEKEGWRLIEISDESGVMLDLLSAPESKLKLVVKYTD